MLFDPLYLVIFVGFTLIGLFVQFRMKSVFEKAKQVPMTNGMSGREVAEKMLREHQIYDVKVLSVEGYLTDHYDPTKRLINLSPDVYNGRTAAAAAVAAHETGHAVQHAIAYPWLKMRSAIVPAVQVSSTIMNFLMIGMLLLGVAAGLWNQALLVIIICQAVITAFTLITLPVEFDASRRALVWLNSSHLTHGEQHQRATEALRWAGMTYLVAALAAIAQLVYFLMLFSGRRE